MARMAKRLTPNVTIYTDGVEDLAQQTVQLAVNDDMKVESRRIARLKKGAEGSSVIMYFDNGDVITEGFLVSFFQIHSSLPDLGHGVLIESTGPQTEERNQRTVCAATRTRTDRPGRHQDQRHVLRVQ